MFDTRAECISDTVSWFPTKVTMPLASSNDLILAGLNDITAALNHPSPGSPLAPLTDSHVAALRQLSAILTNLCTVHTPAPAPVPDPAPAPVPDPTPDSIVPALITAPPLRVLNL
jgi:hypothetical protein